ncbi:hypothetical protein E5Q_00030 [Mixia osmundae IAM 14324]|uniref:AB hydrolase-1 domain-containing protein n=1 Tax=Mixia osmundae (strain CBS 9802 / IAM 14324 / JCM 22182 / KY 12970) TaxID=764103 RepID=G7DS30_MIXOS|nr:hypothetical protein E5Q_00030 [Mixia osmundae IAM 14324]
MNGWLMLALARIGLLTLWRRARWLILQVLVFLRIARPVKLVFAEHPARIGKTTLRQLVEEQCPSLCGTYTAPWLLRNGLLHTVFTAKADFSKMDNLNYERQYIRLPDGGTIGMDFCPPLTEAQAMPDDVPLLLSMHGLSGGSHESYVRGILAQASRPVSQGGKGWRTVVLNFRGCANVPLTSKRLYNSGATDDLRQGLCFISHVLPQAPLLGMGFSLSANLMAVYAGEQGKDTPFKAIAVMGNIYDLYASTLKLEASLPGLMLSKAMASNVRTLVDRHRHAFEDDKRIDLESLFDRPNLTLYAFDTLITAPAAGYRSAEQYYKQCGSINYLQGIEVPYLSLNSIDDPIIDAPSIPSKPSQLSPYMTVATTDHGGHLGWHQHAVLGLIPRKTRWITVPVLEFFSAILSADPTPSPHRRTLPPFSGRTASTGTEVRDALRDDIGFELIGHDTFKGGLTEADASQGLTRGL